MRWVRRTEDGAYIVRRVAEGWTVETVNRRGRNLFGPRLVTPAAALAILGGRIKVSAANADGAGGTRKGRGPRSVGGRLGRQRH